MKITPPPPVPHLSTHWDPDMEPKAKAHGNALKCMSTSDLRAVPRIGAAVAVACSVLVRGNALRERCGMGTERRGGTAGAVD